MIIYCKLALCIDFLTDTRYGLGCSADEIDDTSFIAAANICDELITLASGGLSADVVEHRYTCNGSFETNETPKQVLENMLTSCAGILTYTNGKFRLLVGAWTVSVSLDNVFTTSYHYAKQHGTTTQLKAFIHQ